MYRKILIIMGLVIIGLSVFINMGCSSRINLVKNGTYMTDGLHSGGIKVSKINVYEENKQLIVSGVLRRTNIFHSYPGHVDIAILDKTGSVIDKISVENRMPFIGRSKRKYSSFTAKFDIIPPEGSTIQVKFHEKSSSKVGHFDCGEYLAVPNHNSP